VPDVAVKRAPAVLAAATALVTLAACDSGSNHAARPAAAAQPATVRTATCDVWTAAPTGLKWRLVRGMREFFGGQVDTPGMRGQVLPNPRAVRLFDAYCGQSFAGAFELYRIYGNAAAFTTPRN
jgi:hypothetical protein